MSKGRLRAAFLLSACCLLVVRSLLRARTSLQSFIGPESPYLLGLRPIDESNDRVLV